MWLLALIQKIWSWCTDREGLVRSAGEVKDMSVELLEEFRTEREYLKAEMASLKSEIGILKDRILVLEAENRSLRNRVLELERENGELKAIINGR